MIDGKIRFRIFGSSHSEEIGVSLEGVGFGEQIDVGELHAFVNRRKARAATYSTSRMEPDEIIIESGIENGCTTGGEIVAKIKNQNVRRGDYGQLKNCPRPSHADYAAIKKYGDGYDISGGGKFSGRMTAPLCIAGGVAKQILKRKGVSVFAYVQSIGGVHGKSYRDVEISEDRFCAFSDEPFPLLDDEYRPAMDRAIEKAATEGDSVGGVVECVIFGVPAGSGEPLAGSIESEISRLLFAVPAVKGVEFGAGFFLSDMRGSTANDEFYFDENEEVRTYTNNNGGINGGLANGMPVTFRVAFKPAPSIAKKQRTVNLKTGENVTIEIKGRHDACFVPRAVPAVEAAAALAIINCINE